MYFGFVNIFTENNNKTTEWEYDSLDLDVLKVLDPTFIEDTNSEGRVRQSYCFYCIFQTPNFLLDTCDIPGTCTSEAIEKGDNTVKTIMIVNY